ncbi:MULTISPECIES: hypothetical protein [Nitratireductor]|uniref:hypothetical protein n=1 Tax=Nitratireductor TaxID=245876 RepID=UPI001304F5B1|nr:MULTISPECIES: hypothetical protein [Nitratireductor]
MLPQTAFVHLVEGLSIARAYTDTTDRRPGAASPQPIRWHHRFTHRLARRRS